MHWIVIAILIVTICVLFVKYEKKISILNKMIEENRDAIEKNKKNIEVNRDLIETNQQKIQSNSKKLELNQDIISKLKD